jgi:glycerol kinase
MESGVFLGIDHGGSTTTALLFSPDEGVLASSSVSMPKAAPGPGMVEHDPWNFFRTTLEAATAALGKAGLDWHDVRAMGIANQGETSMAWSADGLDVFGPALSWEDRRTAAYCKELELKGVDELIRRKTGIMLDPYFSASKFHWLCHCLPEARTARLECRLRLGGTDSFVIHHLTKGEVHATDPGTASRTALFDIREVCWDPGLLAAFDLHPDCLPQIRPSCGSFGKVRNPQIPNSGVEITADVVDAHAALFAQGCFDPAVAKATYGTGAFIEVNTGRRMVEPDGKLPVFIAWQLDRGVDYTLEGGVYSVGSAIDWSVQIGLIPSAAETSRLAMSVKDAGGVQFMPSFTGVAAPYWNPNAKAMISGIGLDTTKAHVARALLDGIAFACSEAILTLNHRLGDTLTEVRADGGPSRNPYLMQRQADLLGLPVVVSDEPDMTALGAALLAAIGAHQMTVAEVSKVRRRTTAYEPAASSDRRQETWDQWRRAIRAVQEMATQ